MTAMTPQQQVDLQWLWLHGWPVVAAADLLCISRSSAHRLIKVVSAAMAGQGKPVPRVLPASERPDLCHKPAPLATRTTAPVQVAPITKPVASQPRRHPRIRPLSLEEQIARIAAGARLIPTFKAPRVITEATLGGVGSGML